MTKKIVAPVSTGPGNFLLSAVVWLPQAIFPCGISSGQRHRAFSWEGSLNPSKAGTEGSSTSLFPGLTVSNRYYKGRYIYSPPYKVQDKLLLSRDHISTKVNRKFPPLVLSDPLKREILDISYYHSASTRHCRCGSNTCNRGPGSPLQETRI